MNTLAVPFWMYILPSFFSCLIFYSCGMTTIWLKDSSSFFLNKASFFSTNVPSYFASFLTAAAYAYSCCGVLPVIMSIILSIYLFPFVL